MIAEVINQPIRRDESRARGGLDDTHIHIEIRQPLPQVIRDQVIRNDINPVEQIVDDASRAANQKKVGVRFLVIALSITAIVVICLSIGITQGIVNDKSTDMQYLVNNLNNNLNNRDASLYGLQSIAVTNITTMCANWLTTTMLIINPISCSGCYGQILNAQCSLCKSKNDSTITGAACSGCNITSGTIGYCSYCAVCYPISKIINCIYTSVQMTINSTSCTACSGCVGCSNQYCQYCTDIYNGRIASYCYNCNIVTAGAGYCGYCSY